MSRIRLTLVSAAALLAALLSGRYTAAQDAPLELRIALAKAPGPYPTVDVTFTNRSKAPVAIAPERDGSLYGMVQPHYLFTIERRGRTVMPMPRCGNTSGDYDAAWLAAIAPGASHTQNVSLPYQLTPGVWHVELSYAIEKVEGLGAGADRLFVGTVESNRVELVIPGPVWDEWSEEPAPQVAARLAQELQGKDAGAVGAAVDALTALTAKDALRGHDEAVRAALPAAFTTLLRATLAGTGPTYDVTRHPSLQLAALIESPLAQGATAMRAELRRAIRDGKKAPGRSALVSIVAAHPLEADAELFATLAGDPGDAGTFAQALAALDALRGRDAALAAARALLEKTPPGKDFIDYANGVSNLTDDYEPSYIKVGEHGRMFPGDDAQYRQAKEQWRAWWNKAK